jgi:calcium-dependent protein kinase
MEKTLTNLKNFRSANKLKQAVLTFIASQVITHESTHDLQPTFRELDTDGDGQLSASELRTGYNEIFGTNPSTDFEEMMSNVDTDGSGFIDYSEFIVATMSKTNLLSSDNI